MTSTVTTKEFSNSVEINIKAQTEEDAIAAIENYCLHYPPLGYGTGFHSPRLEGEVWVANGWRARSC